MPIHRNKRDRVSNACQRCRKHKIKCSGSLPCKSCDKRGVRCEFGSDEKMVVVTESYLLDLKNRLHQYESQHEASQEQWQPADENLIHTQTVRTPQSHEDATNFTPSLDDDAGMIQGTPNNDDNNGNGDQILGEDVTTQNTELSNPLVLKHPAYLSDNTGRLLYMGHSSAFSFTQHLLRLASQSPHFVSRYEHLSDIDGVVYKVNGTELTLAPTDLHGLPPLELALFYLQNVKFRTHPLFHLFDESEFVHGLRCFYEDFATYAQANRLWYVHYLSIMALGKAFAASTSTGGALAGSELFNRALRLLPDATVLRCDLVTSTEILCCIALYLQSIDHASASQVYLGQALRMAQLHGLHTDMQASTVDEHFVNRGRCVWWTVYTLDRRLSSSSGLPNGIHDDEVAFPALPSVTVDVTTTAQILHVKLCQLMGRIISTVYSKDSTLKKAFITTAQQVLREIAGLADELEKFSKRCLGEISRVAAQLNLAYHRCVILTSRPLLIHLVALRMEGSVATRSLALAPSMKGLVQVCIDSAIQIALNLSQLRQYDLLDTFLPFDTDNAFCAGLILSIAPIVHPRLCPDETWLESILASLNHIALSGNLLARMRKSEIEEIAQFPDLLREGFNNRDMLSNADDPFAAPVTTPLIDQISLPSLGDPFFDEWIGPDGLSGAQIRNLADALNSQDVHSFLPF